MARYSLFVLKVPLNTNKPNQTVSILCPLPSTGWFQCRDGVGWYPGVIPRLCAVVDKRLVATSWLGRLQSGKCARCWCRRGGNIGRMEEEEGERRGQFCGGVCYSPRRLPVTAAIVVMTARSDVGSVDSGLINCGTPQALWSVAHSLTNE